MADSFVQLPYTATTSGDLLDATLITIGANAVKRERMVVGNDTSSHVAVVTTSGALTVTRSTSVSFSSMPTVTVDSANNIIFGYIAASTAAGGIVTGTTDRGLKVDSTQPVSLTSGTVTLSSAISLSSGIVTLSSPTSLSSGTVTLSSNPTVVLSSPTSLSSGLISFSSAPTVNISSGVISLTSGVILTSDTLVGIIGTSGGQAVVTTSGGILVTFTNSVAGSTAVNLVGSSNAILPGTSSGGLLVTFTNSVAGSTAVSIAGGAGVLAPVTTSGGLVVEMTPRIFTHLLGTVGAPVPVLVTTRECRVYSVACLTTAAVANVVELYQSTTTSLTVASTWIVGFSAAVANTYTQSMISLGGVYSSGGLTVIPRLTIGATGSLAANLRVNVEYSI